MGERRERSILTLAFVVPLVIYLLCAYRDVTYWDVGEMDTVPWILGIAHPTAFPAYVLVAWAFTHLVPIGSVAFRMSALSAIAMSGAAWFVARVTFEEYRSAWAGVAGALLFAFGLVAWSDATRADVHAVATLCFAALLFFALRWYRTGAAHSAYAAAAVFGTGIAVHPVVLTVLPALLVLVIARLHETESRVLLRAIALALASTAVWFAYLPLRSAYVTAHGLDPTLSLGIAPGSAFWDYGHPASLSGFVALVTGAQFSVPQSFAAIGSGESYGHLTRYAEAFVRNFTPVGAFAACAGAIAAMRRDPLPAVVLVLAAVVSVLFGLSFVDESDVARYFLPSFAVAAIFAGAGCALIRSVRLRWLAASAIVAVAAWLVSSQPWFFNQPNDSRARAEIEEVRAATPENSVLVATWVLAPPLAYSAYVEHRLGSRVVDPAWIGDESERLPSWLARRPVYVVGNPQGSVSGYRLERLATRTELYRVVHE